MSREQTLRKPTPEEEAAHAAYMALQIKAMTGPENMKAAELHYGRKVTLDEAAMFFVKNGQAAEYRKKYGHLAEK